MMHTIDVERFFDAYRRRFGRVRQEQVPGLDALVGFINADPTITDYRHAAYMLATVHGECGDTYQPVEEAFYLEGQVADLDAWRARNLRYWPWHGRGYVQLTWRANYAKAKDILGVDLIAYPAKAMEPKYAYRIMSRGMQEGWFTGRELSDHINGRRCDYRNARRIINGTDKARKFAGWAERFDAILSFAEVRQCNES
jgi:hypothetical protein